MGWAVWTMCWATTGAPATVPSCSSRYPVRVLAVEAELALPGRVRLPVRLGPLRAGADFVVAAVLGHQPRPHRRDHRTAGPGTEEVRAGERLILRLLRLRRALRRLRQPLLDPAPQVVHRDAARIDLPRLPLLVADHRVLVPAVRAADRGRGLLDRRELRRGPGVLAVAEVLALEAVEVAVAVGVRLVVRRAAPLLVDHRAQDVVVAETGVVGAAVADEVDLAVLGR